MRKILFSILIILLLVCSVLVIKNGIKIAGLDIWGVQQIQQKNSEIDSRNDELKSLVNGTYTTTLTKLDTSSETLQQTKKEYEEQAILASGSRFYNQTEKYKIEFLWTRIGNYAKDDNVVIRIDVISGEATGIYNLNFSVIGKYSDVAGFIYDIENDSRLGFKIEDFGMTAGSDNNVEGKFSCKGITIDVKSLDDSTKSDSDDTPNAMDREPSSNANNTNNGNNATTNPTPSPTGNENKTTSSSTATSTPASETGNAASAGTASAPDTAKQEENKDGAATADIGE